MTRLERLLNLVAALLDATRPLPRSEIVARVPGYGEGEAGRRAFERDKDTLRSMGIPVVLEPLDAGHDELGEGYRIPPEQYRLPDVRLDPEELAALNLAASSVRLGTPPDGGPGEAGMAIWKLGGAVGAAGAGPTTALPGSEHLPALFAAVGDRRTVRFGYRGRERTLDPHRLTFSNGRWYVTGHDHERAEVRNFRLDRFESAPVGGEAGAFVRPEGARSPAPAPWRLGDEPEVVARLLVDADHASWVEARLGPDAVEERREGGSVVFAVPITNRAAFRTFALGFLEHAEVLGPDELRADMITWLERLAAPAASAPSR